GNGYVAAVRERARRLLVPVVPSRHVVHQHHAGERTGPHRAREIGMDDIATVAAHRHRLGQHSLELISSRHHERPSPFPSNTVQIPSLKSGPIASTNDRSASSRASTPFHFTPGRRNPVSSGPRLAHGAVTQ